MKRILLTLLFAASLPGCVGFSIHGNKGREVYKNNFAGAGRYVVSTTPPDRAPDKQNPDGSVMYVLRNETAWCGVIIWAVIPVPLLLPFCTDRVEMTFKDEAPVQMMAQWTGALFGAACGPFMPLLGLGGGPRGFCGSLAENRYAPPEEPSVQIQKKKPHRGLEASVKKGELRKITPADAQEWLAANTEKYRRQNRTQTDHLRESKIFDSEIAKGRAYVVLGKFTYPSGLQNEDRVIFLIPKGVPEPEGSYGDSKIYHFYTQYFDGPSVEFNAGSEWAAGAGF